MQTFSCYMHVLVVRLFVETVLRYGLPPAFQAAVVKPVEKSEAKLRSELAVAFSDGACITHGRACTCQQAAVRTSCDSHGYGHDIHGGRRWPMCARAVADVCSGGGRCVLGQCCSRGCRAHTQAHAFVFCDNDAP